MTIFLDMDLPLGALLPEAHVEPGPGGILFDAASIAVQDDVIAGWSDQSGQYHTRPAEPNTGNAQVEVFDGRTSLHTRDGVNCGYVVEGLNLSAPVFSMAIAFAPLGRAGTLLTLNPKDGRDYLFLTEENGSAELKFRDDDAPLAVPCEERGQVLLCASVRGGQLSLGVNGGLPQRRSAPSQLQAGLHDLYIGCRSDRAGIKKTLGAALISRIWLWPDEDVFAGETYARLVHMWQKDGPDGI